MKRHPLFNFENHVIFRTSIGGLSVNVYRTICPKGGFIQSNFLYESIQRPAGYPPAPWLLSRVRKKVAGADNWAMCAAVLFPLVKKPVKDVFQKGLPPWVPKYAGLLHNLRAAQLEELRQAGCRDLPKYRVCPPSFVSVFKSYYTCQYLWCPFCWARMVAADLLKSLANVPESVFAECYLAEVRAYEYLPEALDNDQLRKLISTAAKRTEAQLLPMKSLGSFKLTTLEPSNSGWRVRCRILSFIPLKNADKSQQTTSPTYEVVYHRTYGKHHELAKIVGRVCEYPFELLFQPAVQVKRALELRTGLRLMSYSGILRGKNSP